MNVLVTGGAGYIGSHICRTLLAAGHMVYVFDDLSSGHAEVVSGELIEGDLGDVQKLDAIFERFPIDAVVHCAGLINVADSMRMPGAFYTANVTHTLNVLNAMQRAGVQQLVFSSSCSVYGTPVEMPVTEHTPYHPESVYAETKMVTERMIEWFSVRTPLRYAILRYFNACGASFDASTGEWHDPETHLIPNVIRAALRNEPVTIFGNDYETPDGTCIRDYVHVEDLADAHSAALRVLNEGTKQITVNLGSGRGYSNAEIVRAVERELGAPVRVQYAARREGDAARIEASNEKAQQVLGWVPQHDLRSIIRSAIAWEQKQKK